MVGNGVEGLGIGSNGEHLWEIVVVNGWEC